VLFAFEVRRRPSESGPPIAHAVNSDWPWTASLMEPFGALPNEVVDPNSLKDMVGPCGLEPQTSTVSTSRVGLRVEMRLSGQGSTQS